MRRIRGVLAALALCSVAGCDGADIEPSSHTDEASRESSRHHRRDNIQLGPRPYYLVDDMDDGWLKDRLQSCADDPVRRSDFSIGHRGAALQFPEHTRESYVAAHRTGAGILECDVTFTKDRQLVCRHSQCDLHTTTNILAVPELAAKCSQPFTPADPASGTPASALCCTSDITLDEFKSLCGKMDAFDPAASTVEEFLGGTPTFRTDLYATCGTLLTHAESIELFDDLGAKFTPELKAPSVPMPFEGDYTQEQYAQQLIDEYEAAGIPSRRVFAQSFNRADVLYWLDAAPSFGRQAVYLDDRVDQPGGYDQAVAGMPELAEQGVRIVAPPMWALVTLDEDGDIVPSTYAEAARDVDLDIITWTLERSGPLATGGGYYFQSVTGAIDNDGDVFEMLHALAKRVKVRGVFSDWPATVSYYASCFDL